VIATRFGCSFFYLPLWLVSLPTLLTVRAEIAAAAQGTLAASAVRTVTWDVSALAFPRADCASLSKAEHAVPARGVGDNVWDRLWMNRRQMPWLTVYMKDRRIYVGVGVEIALAPKRARYWNHIRELPRGEGVWVRTSVSLRIN